MCRDGGLMIDGWMHGYMVIPSPNRINPVRKAN